MVMFFIQKRSGIYDKTLQLLRQIESTPEKLEVRNIFCSFSTIGSWDMTMHNVYFFQDCIVITATADFDLMKKYRQKGLNTYLLESRGTKIFSEQLFKNKISIKQLDIKDDGEIIVSGSCSTQSLFINPGKFIGDFDITIKIKTNISKENIIEKLKSKQIEKNNWC